MTLQTRNGHDCVRTICPDDGRPGRLGLQGKWYWRCVANGDRLGELFTEQWNTLYVQRHGQNLYRLAYVAVFSSQN